MDLNECSYREQEIVLQNANDFSQQAYRDTDRMLSAAAVAFLAVVVCGITVVAHHFHWGLLALKLLHRAG